MAAATSPPLLSNKRHHIVSFEEELCNTGVATGHGGAGVCHGPGRLHNAGNVGCLSPEEMHVLLWFERHGIVQDALEEVVDSYVALEHGDEGGVVAAEHIDLMRGQKLFSFPANLAVSDLVRH